MCGVLIWHRPPARARFPVFRDALRLQSHRGPDSEGALDLSGVWLGHNRLSILDLSERGNQPMSDPAGRFTIVFNGEIYNYIELREELRASGRQTAFTTGTDTEVILAAFAAWGEACFDRFNGMWALAIWDAREQSLTVSRDRYGIKPLYLSRSSGGITLASEIKPLLALSLDAPKAHSKAIARFFATGNVDGHSQTWFDGVERFPAGGVLSIDRAGAERWRNLEIAVPYGRGSFAAREAEFDDLVADAVRIALRSDVPLGVCLSGGIDSSVIAAEASRTQAIESFTSRHDDPDSDEFPWVEMLAKGRSIGLNAVWPRTDQLLDDISRIVWHLEEPAKATGVLSQWNVMRRARERNVVVLLDGQGGDEVFGGYEFHRWPLIKGLALGGSPGTAAREAQQWGWGKTHLAARAALAERVKRPLRRIAAPFRRGMAERTPWTDHFLNTQLLPELEQAAHLALFDGLSERLTWDIRAEMLPALLRYEDKISMAFSIESRVPLLDYRLVSFAFSLAPDDLIHNGWSKWPLRRTLARSGAPEIAWRRDKKGYPTPMNLYWRGISDQIVEWLAGGVMVEQGIIDPQRVRDVVLADLALPHSRLTWHLLQTEWWFRNFIVGDFRRPMAWT